MEKFMLIFQSGTPQHRSPEAMQAYMGKWMAWIDKLREEGKYLSGEPLLPGGKLVKGPDKKVTDGPYAEAKEIVGGFFIINAENYDDAVAISKDYPDYEYDGSVQIRQVMKM
jgi:hypothetical protein